MFATSDRDLSVLALRYGTSGPYRCGRHNHAAPMLSFYAKGTALDINDMGRSTLVTPYMVNLQPQGYEHDLDVPGETTSICALLKPEFAKLAQDCAAALQRPALASTARVTGIARRIEEEVLNTDSASELILQALYLEMIGELARLGQRPRAASPPWIRKTKELIRDRFRETLSLEMIAAEIGVHPGHLCRTFRRVTGLTVGEYLREVRTQFALQQLRSSSNAIADIAAAAGFADHSHFARECRKRVGMSPQQFRAAHRLD